MTMGSFILCRNARSMPAFDININKHTCFIPNTFSFVRTNTALPATIQRHHHQLRNKTIKYASKQNTELDLDSLLDDLELPDIDADLSGIQALDGATFDPQYNVPSTFGNNARALDALTSGVVLIDRSHWGRLRLSGPDHLSFLHGQSTADITSLKPGMGTDTVFVTPQARCIDLSTVLSQQTGALVIVSPVEGVKNTLLQKLDKMIFPGDNVQISDISSKTVMFSIIGPKSGDVLRHIKADELLHTPYGTHIVFGFKNKPVVAISGAGLLYSNTQNDQVDGYTFICDETIGPDLWRALLITPKEEEKEEGKEKEEGIKENEKLNVVPMGNDVWEIARIISGRPSPSFELTEEYNPLEAGLYNAVSLNKGCYIGQETLSKVHGQDAVRKELWGIILDAPCSIGDEVFAAEQGSAGWTMDDFDKKKSIGVVTSYVDTPQMQHRALAYLKCRFKGSDGSVTKRDLQARRVVVNGVGGTVVALSFAKRSFPEGSAPMEAGGAKKKVSAESKREEEAAEAARREAKLKEMQEKVLAWQQQQQQGN